MVNWITVSSSSGNSGSTVVTVTASSYTELTARTTSLTVRTVNSNLSANVNITQEPKEIITVTVSPTSISAPVSGGTYTFNIASNGAWTITYPSWLQVSQTSGTGNATITVTIPENESYSALTGNIVVSTADNTATVSVSQAAEEEPSRISVSPTTIQNISSGGSAYTLTVTSNTGWRLTDGPSWVRFNATSGSGNTTIVITVVPNSGSARTDNIVFTTTDSAATATVSLSQDAYSEQPTGSTEYLTFEIISGGTIYWKVSTEFAKTIEYQKNNDNWVSITATSTGVPITVSANDIIKFKGNNTRYAVNAGYTKYNTFSGTTAEFKVKGNIMSLIDSTNFENIKTFSDDYNFAYLFSNCTGLTDISNLILPATALTKGCYYSMFYNCTSLTTVPELPATTLANNCYHYMFGGCTSLTTVPTNYLPVTTLADWCYACMFYSCTSLTTAPELPATTLTSNCYYYMFFNCSSLTTAPVLSAAILTAETCYSHMFYGCTSLNYIKCLATTNNLGSNCIVAWVQNVASTGTFVKAANATFWSRGINGIPTGWTVQDAS